MRSTPSSVAEVKATQLVRRNPQFNPSSAAGFTPEDYYFWNRIGPATTVRDLLVGSGVSIDTGTAILRRLLDLGAIELEEDESSDIVIVDQTDLGAVSDGEAQLLREDCELAMWERRRIIAALRLIKRRDYRALLGVGQNASKRDIKRAYFQLSKEFHPDRYYSKKLGSYGALLALIFDTATKAMRTLSALSLGNAGPRRRAATRYPLAVKASVQCDSWTGAREMVTGDISETGMFFPTKSLAEMDARVVIQFGLPSLGTITAHGRIASIRSPATSSKPDVDAGFGIQLTAMSRQDQERYSRLLVAAQTLAPVPADVADEGKKKRQDSNGIPEVQRFARGSGSIRRPCSIIGVDLGTTYTSVSATLGNRVHVLDWADGARAIPSVVWFPERGKYLVGEKARARLLRDPKHTVPAAKRLLGRNASDHELEGYLAQAPYEHAVGADGSVLVEMWGEQYAIPQLCSFLFQAAKETAEQTLGHRVDKTVVTVPVSFTPERIELLRRAAALVHLEVVAVIDEPSAAALANRYRDDFGGIIGVYDFGGGTFDFSVVDVSAGDFRVLATAGDGWLGGDDLDLAMADAAADQFWRAHGVDLRQRAVEWQYLLFSCEHAKRRLTKHDAAAIRVPEVMRTADGAHDLRIRVGRQAAERLWQPHIDRSIDTCISALRSEGLQPSDLSAIFLSGGTSYIPAVQQHVAQRLGIPVRVGVPPEYAACLGAGVHAAQLDLVGAATLPTR